MKSFNKTGQDENTEKNECNFYYLSTGSLVILLEYNIRI